MQREGIDRLWGRRLRWASLLAVAGVALLWPVRPALLIQSETSGFVDILPLRPEEPFGLRYIHSVDLLPLEDWYVVRAGEIVQTETKLLSFGAGMGHIQGVGHGVEDGKWMRVVDMHRRIGTLYLRLGTPLSDFRLLYRGREIPLSADWSHQRLAFRPIRIPFWAAVVVPLHGSVAAKGAKRSQ